MALIALFMIVYGVKLCQAVWDNTIAEFPLLSVGVVYSPIPIGGLFTLLFVIERFTIGRPVAEVEPHICRRSIEREDIMDPLFFL